MALYIAGADQVHLVYVVAAKSLGKVRVFNSLGSINWFFLTNPSRFRVRLMVLSERSGKPSLCSSHLIAETPNWERGSDSKRVLVAIMISFSCEEIAIGFDLGALE